MKTFSSALLMTSRSSSYGYKQPAPTPSFTTISDFEREEKDAEYGGWIDVESQSENGGNSEGNCDEDVENMFCADFDEDFHDDEEELGGTSIQKSWWRTARSDVKNDQQLCDDENHNLYEECMEEHPMRTDEWTIKVKLSPFIILPGSIRREGALFPQFHKRRDRSKKGKSKEQLMKFSPNGYVILLEEGECTNNSNNIDENDLIMNNDNEGDHFPGTKSIVSSSRILSVGKWQMNANGISWKMPAHLSMDNQNVKSTEQKTTFLHYHADIHLSKFQSKPRMFRGTITRDRYDDSSSLDEEKKDFSKKKLFRPVIASFTAEGTGTDTLVLEYKDRGFGLGNNGR
mmetsp:Transcript_4912/g.6005  ORF Transcript_4912/g.6005 Transcript_4912/m.6005 type:complete len:344 (+) Transcript_4912:2-1033(+)